MRFKKRKRRSVSVQLFQVQVQGNEKLAYVGHTRTYVRVTVPKFIGSLVIFEGDRRLCNSLLNKRFGEFLDVLVILKLPIE